MNPPPITTTRAASGRLSAECYWLLLVDQLDHLCLWWVLRRNSEEFLAAAKNYKIAAAKR